MSDHRSFESELLAPAESLVENFVRENLAHRVEARFQLLEAVAARLGGFSLDEFNARFHIRAITNTSNLLIVAKCIIQTLERCSIPLPLALSALAREHIDRSARRTSGAYHTDFRLAQRLAQLVSARPTLKSKVIDPACGAGILLVALSMQVCGHDRRKMARWLSQCVYASDRSANALRGALLSLASLTSDIQALAKMRAQWKVGDSLLAPPQLWQLSAPKGFDVIIANPPWEKVKLSRHEFLKSNGHDRHYGAKTINLDHEIFRLRRANVFQYAEKLSQHYPLLMRGEPDLYAAFAELFDKLCKPGGNIAALLPGGLIRSQGTEALRRHLFGISSRLSISIIENRARFFGIDSRFKFLAINCVKKSALKSADNSIVLRHERGTPEGLAQFGAVEIGRKNLARVRPDLSVPEVRSRGEWQIFRHMIDAGEPWRDSASPWYPAFCREVDMTNDRPKFRSARNGRALPLVEGRMVQQHRLGAKEYLEGTGRKARWKVVPFGSARIAPQFYIAERDVPDSSRTRINRLRAGFCDITGQTNERSLMAAIIPPGVVCGNKVPTVLFPNEASEDRLIVWCSIMNSVPFDWLARRIITTTVNYFLLLSLPLPRLVENGLPWRRLLAASQTLRKLDELGVRRENLAKAAELRALIDAEIAVAYGLDLNALATMLNDFPLLDRGQPALHGEEQSTITKDLILSAAAKRMRRDSRYWLARIESAERLGAVAYVPSETADIAAEKSSHAYGTSV